MRLIIKILSILAVISLIIASGACSDDMPDMSHNFDGKIERNTLDSLNKYLVSQEKEAINEYILNSGADYLKTCTGLCYRIINQGYGELIQKGNIVVLDYELRLLNGDLVYSSDENGKKAFVVGHGNVESGLEEAVLYLHKGDEAEIVIPSHLAYGLTGDGNGIPIRSTLVYKVKVIENQLNK